MSRSDVDRLLLLLLALGYGLLLWFLLSPAAGDVLGLLGVR